MIDIKHYNEPAPKKSSGYPDKNTGKNAVDERKPASSSKSAEQNGSTSENVIVNPAPPEAEVNDFFDIIDIDTSDEPGNDVPKPGIIDLYEPELESNSQEIEADNGLTAAAPDPAVPSEKPHMVAHDSGDTAENHKIPAASDLDPISENSGATVAAEPAADTADSTLNALPAPSQDFDMSLASSDVQNLVPVAFASRYKIVPLGRFNDKTQIAIADPADINLLDEIRWVLGTEIEPLKAAPDKIEEWLRLIYGIGAETVGQILDEKSEEAYIDLNAQLTTDLDEESEEASIIKFVNALLLESLEARATDIHIEPFEKNLRIRHRVDGILYEIPVPSSLQHLHQSIVSRIKIMANLNIAEQRLPQDGRIKVKAGQRALDMRISTLPTPFGESVNLRILNSNEMELDLSKLGLFPRDLVIISKILKKPHGIVLVTGPTGSGKTTTLYSCLNRLNVSDRKIITVEDPIEYQLPGITQIQVNPKIGLTFAQGLRSMLRHDPDIMLLGEIRDHETAEVTIQVAMTGHLVFSTLHTNDAPSAIARLINMGIEPYLLASSIECIIAQRLVRKICPHCKTEEDDARTRILLPSAPEETPPVLYRGSGCKHCHNTGYWGRTAIYEFLQIDDEIRDHIISKTSSTHLRELAIRNGMVSLRQDGMEKIKAGITTFDEVLKVTQEVGDV